MGHPDGSQDGIATIPSIVLAITGQSWLSSNRVIRVIQFLRAAIQRPFFISVLSTALICVLLLLLQQVSEDSFAQQNLPAVLTARFINVPSVRSRNFRSNRIWFVAMTYPLHLCNVSTIFKPEGVGQAYTFWQIKQVDTIRPLRMTLRIKIGSRGRGLNCVSNAKPFDSADIEILPL